MSFCDIDFFISEFWIQVYNLPFDWKSPENAIKIGNIVARYLEIDNSNGGFVAWENCRVINESSFVEYWMFKLGSNLNQAYKLCLRISLPNSPKAWDQLGFGFTWFISQVELKLKFNIKLLSSKYNTNTLLSPFNLDK